MLRTVLQRKQGVEQLSEEHILEPKVNQMKQMIRKQDIFISMKKIS